MINSSQCINIFQCSITQRKTATPARAAINAPPPTTTTIFPLLALVALALAAAILDDADAALVAIAELLATFTLAGPVLAPFPSTFPTLAHGVLVASAPVKLAL